MNRVDAKVALHQGRSSNFLGGFDLRELCTGVRNDDGSMGEIASPDAKPLPAINDLPGLNDGLELLVDQLIALQPVDTVADLRSLTTDSVSGLMYRERDTDKQPKLASYTASAIGHLCYFWNSQLAAHNLLPRSPGANLLWYAPKARRSMIDDIRSRLLRDRKVTVRLLTFSKPIIRAVTSDVHALDTGDMAAVARQLMKTIPMVRGLDPTDCRIWFSWTWDTARMSVYFGEDRNGVRAVANLALSETKAHSWFASGGVHIAGVTYWGWAPAANAHGRHVGQRVAERMVDAIWDAHSMREKIIDVLDQAKATPVPGDQVEALLRRFRIPSSVIPADELILNTSLFALIDRLYRVENFATAAEIAPEQRVALRDGLGELLKAISEKGVEGVVG